MARNRRAELHTTVRVNIGEVERALGRADGLGRNARTRKVERHHGVLEAHARLLADQVLLRHAHIVEVRLDDGHAADAHLVLDLLDRKARRALLDHDGADAARLRGRVRDAEDRVDVGDAAVRGPLLLARDDVVVAVLDRGHREARGVRTGVLLRQAEGDELFAARDLRQPVLLLRFGAADENREAAERVHGEGHAKARVGLRELFRHARQGQNARAVAAVFLGDEGLEQAGLRNGLGRLVVVLLRLVVLGGRGAHMLVRDLAGNSGQFFGDRAENDVVGHTRGLRGGRVLWEQRGPAV